MTTSFPLDRYVAEVLMQDLVGHDRAPAAFLVYLYLWARAGGRLTTPVTASLADIADGTGLSKRTVQIAVARLKRRRFVKVAQAHATATPVYAVQTPWRR